MSARRISAKEFESYVEEALASAYKAWMRQHDPDLDEEAVGVRVELDPETGAMKAWTQELDVET